VAPDLPADVVLADGRTVGVRAVEAADEPGLRALLDGLSAGSRALRFFSAATDVAAASRFAAGSAGVVAVAGDPQQIVGHALWVSEGAGRAEIAFEVADAWHGRGVATALLGAAAARAAEQGIETLTAVVLPENHAMIRVFRDSGFAVEVETHPGELSVELATRLDAAALRRFGERERAAAVAALGHFLAPASVAVIGASGRPGSVGAAVLANLAATFDGPVHAVGRDRSVLDLPDPVDLAVVAVPAGAVDAVARDCAAKGVRALLVLSGGFEDAAGRAHRARLAAFCRGGGMRLVGPNCLGVASPVLTATFARPRPMTGSVALVSQSGGIGVAALEQGAGHGVGLSAFVSIGDRADVSSNDVIQWCEQDPATAVIALYLESFGNPRRFGRIARRVTRTKPIVAVKAGRSAAGRRAAGSHTGALVAASEATVDALFAQAGVVRTGGFRELLDVAALLAARPAPAGPRLGVVTNAGGPAILLADAAEPAGLELPPPAPGTAERLEALLPGGAAGNPVDVLGDASPSRLGDAVAAMASDPAYDAIAVVYAPTVMLDPEAAAAAVADGLGRAGREVPAAAVFLVDGPPPAALHAARIPAFAFPEDAARALGAAARYGGARARPDEPPVALAPPPQRDAAAALLAQALAAGREWLTPEEIAGLAACYGLPLVAWQLVRSAREAGEVARAAGAPVVLKGVADGLVHRSDAGAVITGLRGPTAVVREARAMRRRLRDQGLRHRGFLVQPMAAPGVELLVGATNDPSFGPAIACAAGGTATELLADAAIRLAPLSETDVREMPRSLTTFPLLTGHRGAPPADVTALEDVLRRVSVLADDQPAIAELDCNPVIVGPDGAAIVDMRVRIAAPPRRAPVGSLQGP
jgi:acyl-CoA synthetase (NDP forming)/GNAT superfamily N-acetyltransferase